MAIALAIFSLVIVLPVVGSQRILKLIEIEHINAVKNIETTIRVPGIDCLFVGPYGLSASMGKMGLVTDPEVQKAISHVTKVAKRAKIPLGIFGDTTEAVETHIRSGYTLIALGIDSMLVANAIKGISQNNGM